MSRRPLELAIGERCQDRCVFCSDLPDVEVTVPFARLLTRMEAARVEGATTLQLSGLEPTLREDFLDLVQTARDLGYERVLVITNGRRFRDPVFTEHAMLAGVTDVIVSIHAHTPELEARIVGDRDSWDDKVGGICELAGRAHVEANTVVTVANLPHLSEVARFLATLDLERWNVHAARPFGWGIRHFADAIPPIALAGAAAGAAARIARASGLPAFVCDFPACALPGGADLVGEPEDKEVIAVLKSGKEQPLEGLTKKLVHKVKGEPCAACAASPRCEGVYREYVARRGWSEIRPVPC